MIHKNAAFNPPPVPEPPSKSQRKRDMHALQALGEQLAALSPQALATLPIEANLHAALAELSRLNGREARRRQLQYIGRLMRREDAAVLTHALAQFSTQSTTQKQQVYEAEQWRERLLNEGAPALTAFLTAFPGHDVQPLQQLLRTLWKTPASALTSHHKRALFRMIRTFMTHE